MEEENAPAETPAEDEDLKKENEDLKNEVEELKQQIEELKNKDESSAEALANAVAEQKSAVILAHADRLTPDLKKSVEVFAKTATVASLKAFLGAFPMATHPARDTSAPEPPKGEDMKETAQKEGDAKAAALFGIDVKSFDAIKGNTVALTGWVK